MPPISRPRTSIVDVLKWVGIGLAALLIVQTFGNRANLADDDNG